MGNDVGSVTDWKKVARKAQAAKGKVADTTLWIDSIDLPLIGTQSISRTGDRWSYNLNGAGLRFATVSDASGRVLKVWGGHTPKLHDSEFLSVNRDEFEEVFAGGVVAGDNHFAKGQKIFDDPLVGLSNQKDLTSEDVMIERHSKGLLLHLLEKTNKISIRTQ